MIGKKKKVLVGMSGGVDSGTSAAILKHQGYLVTGVFLRFWKEDKEKEKNLQSIRDVKKICKILDIPLKIIDARGKFKNCVVKYFLDGYNSGITPNPCVFCNENIKFKILFDLAKKYKPGYVATGHYARIVERGAHNAKLKRFSLKQAKDKNKDQSYFLYRLKQEQLEKLIFPLGDYTKPEVRKMARKFKLPVFDKSESQDICFMKDDDTARFLRENLKLERGDIIDSSGDNLGCHQGLPLYTIGQRRGINVGGTGPYYVVAKDAKNNILTVSNDQKELKLYSEAMEVGDLNWIAKPKIPSTVLVKIRYRQQEGRAIIKKENGGVLKVKFAKPQRAVTPGQSAVFYGKNGEVLGGGIII